MRVEAENEMAEPDNVTRCIEHCKMAQNMEFYCLGCGSDSLPMSGVWVGRLLRASWEEVIRYAS